MTVTKRRVKADTGVEGSGTQNFRLNELIFHLTLIIRCRRATAATEPGKLIQVSLTTSHILLIPPSDPGIQYTCDTCESDGI